MFKALSLKRYYPKLSFFTLRQFITMIAVNFQIYFKDFVKKFAAIFYSILLQKVTISK